MPWIHEPPTLLDKIQTLPVDKETDVENNIAENSPSFFSDTVPALLRENDIGTFFADERGVFERFSRTVRDPDFDPFENINGYEDYVKNFIYANSPAEVDRIKSQIDRERADQETIKDSGWLGTLGSFANGVLSPLTLIPVGGATVQSLRAGKNILGGALATSRAAILGSSVSEMALHATQETRTLGESAANVSGSAFLGGILGGAAGALRTRQITKGIKESAFVRQVEEELTLPKEGQPDFMAGDKITLTEQDLLDGVLTVEKVGEGGSLSSAMVDNDARLKPFFGYDPTQISGKSRSIANATLFSESPNLRTITSPFKETRLISRALAESPLRFETPNFTFAAETEIKALRDSSKFSFYNILESEFLAYRQKTGATGLTRTAIGDTFGAASREGKLTFDEFKARVSDAMRNGDTHEIPHVKQVAAKLRKDIVDPYKNEAVRLGMLPEDLKVKTAESYFMRVYDRGRITARRDEFRQIIMRWLKEENPKFDLNELVEQAEKIIDHTLGISLDRVGTGTGGNLGSRGALKERVFDIPDSYIKDFLVNDVEVVMNRYLNSIVPDVVLTRTFGDVSMKKQLAALDDEIKSLKRAIKDSDPDAFKKRAELDARARKDRRDIEAMRDILRGTYQVNEQSILNDIIGTAKTLNYARLLGGVVLSSLNDIAGSVFVHGMGRTIRDRLVPFVAEVGNFSRQFKAGKGTSAYKAARQELKDLGVAVEMLTNSRAHAISDMVTQYKLSKLESFNKGLAKGQTYLSGIAAYTDMVRTSAAYMGMARILRAATSTKLGTKDLDFLSHYNIDPYMLRKIKDQYSKHGRKENGAYTAGLNNWTDKEAYTAFQFAIRQITDATVLQPGLDKPLFMYKPMLSLMTQFKTFFFSAHQRYFLAGLQRHDLEALSGSVSMVGLGMMQYAIKSMLAGRELSDDPEKWVIEGIDQSGITGLLMEANNTLENVSGNRLGMSSLAGTAPTSRYSNRNLSSTLGPTFGLTEDVVKSFNAIFDYIKDGQKLSPSQVSAIRRMIPFQNTLVLRKLFDLAEEGLRDNLGE